MKPGSGPVPPIDYPHAMLTGVSRKTLEDRVQLPRLYISWLTPPLLVLGGGGLLLLRAHRRRSDRFVPDLTREESARAASLLAWVIAVFSSESSSLSVSRKNARS